MDAIEAILTRRSIRVYAAQPIPDNLIHEFLEAGMAAPSANDHRPWHFIVVRKREILEGITKVHPFSDMLKQAGAAIAICGDRALERQEGYIVEDCSAATQNILLAAHARGIGGVWLGVYPRSDRMEGIGRVLGIPDTVVPVSIVSLGYPAESKPRENRWLQERVHIDHW